jgi:hypothetical protein
MKPKCIHGINAKTTGGHSQLSMIAKSITFDYLMSAHKHVVYIADLSMILIQEIAVFVDQVAQVRSTVIFIQIEVTNSVHGIPKTATQKNREVTFTQSW